MGVHARPVLPEQGLGHERGVPPVFERDLLDRYPVGHAVVGQLQGVAVADIDLVLGGPRLVMGVSHVDPQLLEREHGLAPHVGPGIQGR